MPNSTRCVVSSSAWTLDAGRSAQSTQDSASVWGSNDVSR
jgi:hypothetical protein